MTNMQQHWRIRFALLSALWVVTAQAQPALPHQPTVSEMLMLPPACQAKLRMPGNPPENSDAIWVKRMGAENYMHLHHHCYGMNYLNRARFTFKKNDKRHYLSSSIGEFNYVLQHWPADSPLRPEAASLKQMAENMLKGL